MGYGKIVGELGKVGYTLSEQTIANILKRHGIRPAPERQGSVSWRQLITHYKEHLLACDFFTVDTLFLQTVYVLFFIELQMRRVYLAGCTNHPDAAWVTQQARQMVWQLEEREPATHFLLHDRDTKFVRLLQLGSSQSGAWTTDSYPRPSTNSNRQCLPSSSAGGGITHDYYRAA